MGDHAELSPSSADRWINCPPSVELSRKFPSKSSDYAKEGALAHAVAEIILREKLGMLDEQEARRLLESHEMSLYYTKDMPENVSAYVNYIVSNAIGADFIALEEQLSLTDYVPDSFGTSDAVIIKGDTLEVIDLKYGQGVHVSATNNPQFRLYALGAIQEWIAFYPFVNVRCTVIQPRLDNISSEDISVSDLLHWAENTVRPAALLAHEGKGEYKAGNHCRWCAAKALCRKRAEANIELARLEFAEPALLTNEDISDVLDTAERLSKWVSDVKDYALDQALNHGVSFHGFKLVEGRSSRSITNESKAVEILKENGIAEEALYKKSIIGLPGLEKLVGKRRLSDLLKDLIVKPHGKPALVPVDDKRPELNSAAAAALVFND